MTIVKEEEVRRVVDAAIDPATRDFNLEVLRGAEVDAETLGSIVSTPPMMAERRVVVLRDVGALKKAAREMLDKYLKKPAPDLLLLLVSPAGAKADKNLVTRTHGDRIRAAERRAHSEVDRVLRRARSRCRRSPTSAITLLQEAAGTELAQLKIELDKLVAFTGGGTINEAAISAVVGVRPGETLGDLLDAVARRDATAALAMLPAVLQQPKSGGVPIVLGPDRSNARHRLGAGRVESVARVRRASTATYSIC